MKTVESVQCLILKLTIMQHKPTFYVKRWSAIIVARSHNRSLFNSRLTVLSYMLLVTLKSLHG